MLKNSNDILKAHLALLGANLFYGAGFSVAKSIMPSLIQPNGFILIRVLGASFLFWLSFLGGKNYQTKIEKSDWLRIALCGVFGVALNQLLFFQGLKLTSPIHASLMMLSTPIIVSIFAAYVLKEKLNWKNKLGLLLGVGGASVLILLKDSSHVATNIFKGNLFVLLNATSYSVYFILVKPLMAKYRPIIVIRWVFLIGSIIVFPFGIQDLIDVNWHLFQPLHFLAVGFIVIGVTFFTYLWNIYSLKVLSPSIAGAYIYLQPLFAAVISVLFLAEKLTLYKIIAAIFIFTGVYLASKKKN